MPTQIGRRRAVIRLALGSAAIGAGLTAPGARAAGSRYGILGQPAPDITARAWIDARGQPTAFDMSSVRRKWVYLKCFQSWRPGCHRHGLPTLKKVVDAFEDDERVAFLAVQTVFEGFWTNTEDKVRETQVQYGLPILMGHDPGDPEGDHRPPTMRRYRTGGTPWIVIINPAGRVVFNGFHVDGDRFISYLRTELG